MSRAFCVYPWDLIDDPDATARVRDAGADGVAIAAVYHSVRAATPLHPRHRVVDARDAALYVPVRPEAWGEIRPSDHAPWVGPRAFERAAAVAREAGLRVEAWIVLTHACAIGERHPERSVVDAWGHVHVHALCPSHPEVREYAATLVAEVAAAAPLDGVMLEACGPLGLAHLSAHEKTSGADWSADVEALLSICFCTACVAALAADGVDPDALRAEVRARVDADGSTDGLEAVLAVRARARRLLLEACVGAARAAGVARVVVHADPDPWATGPFAALLDDVDLVDGVILADAVVHDPDAVRALRSRLPGTRLGGWMWAMPPATAAGIRAGWPRAIAGIDDAYAYHLGLVGPERLAAVGDALRAGAGAGAEGPEAAPPAS
ncbi:hypothetical protein C5E16_06870 [Clavibacter michiganensis]|uniref:Alanine-rich protein n=1 Tax=Clavibacter michiganensis TaxID=28447 RepID=A0A2S5VV34_9MICO|nr:hypothetical protein [Clavibacter michiganensis]PPF68579.1 hypothetical protein C5E16_06870 [Clavibacter michiganensis]